MATAPVLNLTTLVTPVHVRIDGALYELRRPGTLNLEELAQVDVLRPKVLELQARLPTASAVDLDELKRLLVALCALVLVAPADVQARLSDEQRIAILQAFQTLPASPPPTTEARPARRARPIGARSSRASRASMGVVP